MICIPIVALDSEEAVQKMVRAEHVADVLEVRLDLMESFDLKRILGAATKPVMITYRSKKEGGRGGADYGTRSDFLMNAVAAGAAYVDVEYSMPLEFRHKVFQMKGASNLIISSHLSTTPSRKKLEERLRKMAATGAYAVKIVTRAASWEDNLRVLGLISKAQSMGVRIIAFSMGNLGRMSRVFSVLMGGLMTFASLEQGQESAQGQLPVQEMTRLLDLFSS